jgi:CBS domain containing-hemolysin-like protein
MTLLSLYVLGTFAVSFLSSLAEAVTLTVSPAYVALLEKKGRRSGRLLHALHDQIDKPLAAILTFNTVSNTAGSMLIGQEVTKLYGDTALGLASGLLTFGLLVFAEILPKNLGARHAKKIAPGMAYVITTMVYITLPVVYLSRIVNRLFAPKNDAHSTTREEMIETAEIGADEGVLHAKETRIIKNLLMLDKVKVVEIMTPRSVVNAFDAAETVDSIMNKYKPVRFSRIPLYEGTVDNIIGLLHRYKLMEAVSHDLYNMPLKDIMTSIHRVKEDTPASVALDQFIKRREHLFLVVDSAGIMTGIVTLEDAIETLLGVEIVDEYDTVTDMRQYALEQWRLKKQALILAKKT